MAREIPEVVRAAAGLAAIVLDEARKIPETLPGLPVRVIGLAMQSAMKIQQQYAGFVARGDELFTGLRGEDEPGLATFDDDDFDDLADDDAPAASSGGYRESAFDRAEAPLGDDHIDDVTVADDAPAAAAEKPARAKAAKAPKAPKAPKAAKPPKPAKAPRKPRTASTISDAEVSSLPADAEVPSLPADPVADVVVAAVEDVAEQVEGAQQTLDALPGEAPSTEEVLEELAIEEMVSDAPVATTESAPGTDTAPTGDPDVTADVATTADVLATDDRTATVDAGAEPVAEPPAAAAEDTGTPARTEAPTADSHNGSAPSGSRAGGTAPIDDYDSFSIAQLRGRLRGYALTTVGDLVTYEEATRAREPYLRMLRNRLEKLEEQAVESSPLAPRGA